MLQSLSKSPWVMLNGVQQEGPWTGLNPGLSPMHPDDWIEIDAHYDEEIEEKRQLLRSKPVETFSVRPEVCPLLAYTTQSLYGMEEQQTQLPAISQSLSSLK